MQHPACHPLRELPFDIGYTDVTVHYAAPCPSPHKLAVDIGSAEIAVHYATKKSQFTTQHPVHHSLRKLSFAIGFTDITNHCTEPCPPLTPRIAIWHRPHKTHNSLRNALSTTHFANHHLTPATQKAHINMQHPVGHSLR